MKVMPCSMWIIILTNAFINKTRKTPPGEIALAQKYKADYERRHKK